jgi:hypothetical protein
MKLYFAIIFIALNSALGFSQEAEFLFLTPSKLKLDQVNEGEVIRQYFVFTNQGDAPLIINDYKVTCSCTQLEYPKYPIAPGSKDSLLLTFDSKGKYYWQNRVVEIQTNTPKKVKIKFKVYVVPQEED